MTTPDFSYIAAQLRHPKGDDGRITAERMRENNYNMIAASMTALDVRQGEQVLELGPGGGHHVGGLMDKAANLVYTGVDISHTMVEMANRYREENLPGRSVTFCQAGIEQGWVRLPFLPRTFDRAFTVNTIYFWDAALEQAGEIYRVLKNGGTFVVGFASAQFMRDLPFTAYNFRLYEQEEVCKLLEQAGFDIAAVDTHTEVVQSVDGNALERTFYVVRALKPVKG